MPNRVADDFDAIRENLERIKKEQEEGQKSNGVDVSNNTEPTQEPQPMYLTGSEQSNMDPKTTEAYKRYYEHPVGGVTSSGWGILWSIG